MLLTMIHGFPMALADSVPGVSGGTIAFIMGFYERFLTALHQLFGKDRAGRRDAFLYLVKFAVGWCIGMGGSVLLLSHIFESNIYFLSALFLGLTVSAIPFIIYEERNALRGHYQWLLFTVLGMALVIAMTAFRGSSGGIGNIDFQNLGISGYVYLLFSGILAIAAMLLPGVSGSTMLLILGVYVPAIHAARELLHLQMQYLPGVIALAFGICIGVVFASRLIRAGLRRFRPQMIYLILGLLVGSLYAIVMGPTTLQVPQAPVSIDSFQCIAFVIGIAILAGLEFLKRHIGNQTKAE